MICAWKELLNILPLQLRAPVDQAGKESLRELRLRINAPPELVGVKKNDSLKVTICEDDLNFVVNAASRYSPWCTATIAKGYLTAYGGHRIGICGDAIIKNGRMEGIRKIRSLCIRVARDYPGIGKRAATVTGSLLIIGPPGYGKTTLLRDIIRCISQRDHVCVIDERNELFPEGFSTGEKTDILRGCTKTDGIEMLLRTMGPEYIAVDEVTANEDIQALVKAANCGVHLLATAHASSIEDLCASKYYRQFLDAGIFDHAVCLKKDNQYTVERMAV